MSFIHTVAVCSCFAPLAYEVDAELGPFWALINISKHTWANIRYLQSRRRLRGSREDSLLYCWYNSCCHIHKDQDNLLTANKNTVRHKCTVERLHHAMTVWTSRWNSTSFYVKPVNKLQSPGPQTDLWLKSTAKKKKRHDREISFLWLPGYLHE